MTSKKVQKEDKLLCNSVLVPEYTSKDNMYYEVPKTPPKLSKGKLSMIKEGKYELTSPGIGITDKALQSN